MTVRCHCHVVTHPIIGHGLHRLVQCIEDLKIAALLWSVNAAIHFNRRLSVPMMPTKGLKTGGPADLLERVCGRSLGH
eukprot:scaffold589214_cov48-Prasinocladus_malaysianus.AAC.2